MSGNDLPVKRKKQQISIGDYFSKRRKMPSQGSKGDDEKNVTEAKIEKSSANSTLLQESEAEKLLTFSNEPDENSSTPSNGSTDTEAKPQVNIPADFNRMSSCMQSLGQIVPSADHTVLFHPNIIQSRIPKPYPDEYRDHWDRTHVRMPCSEENLYPTANKKIQKRWELIESTLLQPFQTSKDLEEAILVYNHHYKDKWNFEAWHSYCNIQLDDIAREDLFTNLLPNMVNLALQLPTIVTQSLKLLQKGKPHSLTLSQEQAACLLANAFFCTFPKRNSLKTSDSFGYPDINFSKLFRGVKDVVNGVKTEKLKAILTYFRRVLMDMPSGTLTYCRKVLIPEFTPNWENCNDIFTKLYTSAEGTIEDDTDGLTQVDFANRMIGGGVVGEGCVQEEIRFLICPELILARLFTEKLEPNESLLITGIERFSNYSGYAQTFRFVSEYTDLTLHDRWQRRYTQVLAIDAHVFHCYSDQFRSVSLKRELEKAYCGFAEPGVTREELPAIATGNWGCGAFGGDIHLKALLQCMAASKASRDVVYFTFGDTKFAEELKDMHDFLVTNSITIGHLWHLLTRYGRELKSSKSHIALYPYLKEVYKDYACDTDASSDDGTLEMRGVPCEIPADMIQLSPDYQADTP